jgi:hypothetical protein
MDLGEMFVSGSAIIAMIVGLVCYLMPGAFSNQTAPAFVMSLAVLALVSSASHIGSVACVRDNHGEDDECGNMGPGYWINMVILIVSSIVIILMLLTMTGLLDFVGEVPIVGSKMRGAADSLTRMTRGGEVPPAFGRRGFRY